MSTANVQPHYCTVLFKECAPQSTEFTSCMRTDHSADSAAANSFDASYLAGLIFALHLNVLELLGADDADDTGADARRQHVDAAVRCIAIIDNVTQIASGACMLAAFFLFIVQLTVFVCRLSFLVVGFLLMPLQVDTAADMEQALRSFETDSTRIAFRRDRARHTLCVVFVQPTIGM